MIDLCTRFCVLRAIPNKQSDTIVMTLIQVFGVFGFPRYLESDNGKEFVNTLVTKLSESTGFDHRLVTPYHPRANGVAERWVQTSVKTLKKLIKGSIKDWDFFVPSVQLAINAKVSSRHDTSPYSLTFARKMNTFSDYRNEQSTRPMTMRDLQERITAMETVVFPAINERVQATIKAQKDLFDKKHVMVDYRIHSHVMVKTQREKGTLEPEYEGPYRIVRKTTGGTYVLQDELGELLGMDYAPSQLKLISHDTPEECDDLYVVDRIVAHKETTPGTYIYKVRWEGYQPEDDTWESAESFTQKKNNPRLLETTRRIT